MMNEATAKLVREWVAKDGGDRERTARWMSSTLRIGGLGSCRLMVAEATGGTVERGQALAPVRCEPCGCLVVRNRVFACKACQERVAGLVAALAGRA